MSKEGRELLSNENSLSMMKVWLALEVRQFIHASVQDVSNLLSVCILFFAFFLEFLNFLWNPTLTQIHALVKSDMLSPNV